LRSLTSLKKKSKNPKPSQFADKKSISTQIPTYFGPLLGLTKSNMESVNYFLTSSHPQTLKKLLERGSK